LVLKYFLSWFLFILFSQLVFVIRNFNFFSAVKFSTLLKSLTIIF
jgi:hypothetical protein